MSEFYVPGAGATIRWNDPFFKIDWPMEPVVISEKDKTQPDFIPGC
jgi:dTDP-4-dehydrorhamnose 3,5-epimerase